MSVRDLIVLNCITVYTIHAVQLINTIYTEADTMSAKAMNFKMDEVDIIEMKKVASVYNMTVTDLIKNAVKDYIAELKRDPFYRLTSNVQEASEEESEEIISEIGSMSDEDLAIVSKKRFEI